MYTHEHQTASSPVVQVDTELADLIPRYLSNRWADLGRARQLLADGDYAGLSRIAHTIRGSAASYGFVRLGEIARAIETAADVGDAGSVATQLAAYDAFLCSVRIEYV